MTRIIIAALAIATAVCAAGWVRERRQHRDSVAILGPALARAIDGRLIPVPTRLDVIDRGRP